MARTLPNCADCPFVVPASEDSGWCHVDPPQVPAFNAAGNAVSTYPPVRLSLIGCARHPKWPKR